VHSMPILMVFLARVDYALFEFNMMMRPTGVC